MTASLAKQNALSAQSLKERVSYDALTGLMIWRKCRSRYRVGQEIGALTHDGYRFVVIGGYRYAVHRLIWLYVHGVWPLNQIDHINNFRSDNRLNNLREATNLQNLANRRAQKNRALKGITFHRGRWQAQIRHAGRNLYLGLFNTAQEAHEAYFAKAKALHGEFARAA
jgi:hypothetical protein